MLNCDVKGFFRTARAIFKTQMRIWSFWFLVLQPLVFLVAITRAWVKH